MWSHEAWFNERLLLVIVSPFSQVLFPDWSELHGHTGFPWSGKNSDLNHFIHKFKAKPLVPRFWVFWGMCFVFYKSLLPLVCWYLSTLKLNTHSTERGRYFKCIWKWNQSRERDSFPLTSHFPPCIFKYSVFLPSIILSILTIVMQNKIQEW